jgi:hypothetical protein
MVDVLNMANHTQTFVKVNAPVDSGISGIVSALSEFPKLETIESCEGDESNGPWVCFRYGSYWNNSWCEIAEFVLGYLSPNLIEMVGDDVQIGIKVKPSGNILGELSIRPGAAPIVEAAIKGLAREFSVCQRHNSEFSGGML